MIEVVVGALVRDGRVLLGHRRADKRAYPDVWELPGGVMEAGESELDALARELREELGVEIAADEPAVLSAWLVTEWEGAPANLAPEEHDDIGWFGLHELPPPAHEVVRAAVVDAMRSC